MGADPEQEYFVGGATKNLTTDLSRITGAFVIARNTAFTFKGKPVDVKKLGRELNVRYVLEGSVQRGGLFCPAWQRFKVRARSSALGPAVETIVDAPVRELYALDGAQLAGMRNENGLWLRDFGALYLLDPIDGSLDPMHSAYAFVSACVFGSCFTNFFFACQAIACLSPASAILLALSARHCVMMLFVMSATLLFMQSMYGWKRDGDCSRCSQQAKRAPNNSSVVNTNLKRSPTYYLR
jgi:hypothetical protein